MIKFRRELPDGATLMVAKNTLMRRASENTKFSTISECSKGMNAWLFVDENVAPTFKKFRSLAKDWKKEGVFEKYKEDMKRRYRHGRNNAAWSIRSTVLPNHLYPDIWIANKGIEAIQNMPTNKPWLLWISFIGPHEPFDTPKQWEEYKKNSLPRFIEQANWIKRLRDGTELKENAESWKDYLNKESIDACRTDYANNLQLLDNQLRRLIDALENTQSANRTAILVTADHGEMLGDHQMLYKSTFLEASIRVPFLYLSLIHIRRCRRYSLCRSRWSQNH